MRTVAQLAVLIALSAGGAFGLAGVPVAHAQEADSRRADLEDVRQRLREVESVITETEASRSAAQQQVAEAERNVSRVARALREVAEERAAVTAELIEHENAREAVETRIEERQTELGAWLRRHYMHGGSDVAPLLSGGDPNQLARDAHYLEYLGRARLELLEGLRADLAEQRRLVEAVREREARVIALEKEQSQKRRELEAVHARRAAALAQLSGRLHAQQREAGALRENEQELERVVEALARQEARRGASGGQARTPASIVPGAGQSEAVVGRVSRLAGPSGSASFRQLRGRLGFPVQGELIGRFGAPRADGGTRWRGLFIRSAGAADVVAIAAGKVVFSDWMRGYGNLIIVDHGDEFLSIYGNNDALLRVVGDTVEGGVPIASVGPGGEGRESGLYFELRHKGEPVDPMQWLRDG